MSKKGKGGSIEKRVMWDMFYMPLLMIGYGSLLSPFPLMCRSNCSAPIPPPGSPGVRENMRVIKKGGALEKRVILVII